MFKVFLKKKKKKKNLISMHNETILMIWTFLISIQRYTYMFFDDSQQLKDVLKKMKMFFSILFGKIQGSL